jgi:very-short-patch-repair endonuclease
MKYICLNCKKEFFAKQSAKRIFCSIQCRCKSEGTLKTDLMNKANLGKHCSEETKEKIRRVHLGKPKKDIIFHCFKYFNKLTNKKQRKYISLEQRLGGKKSELVKKAISLALKGKPKPKGFGEKLKIALKGNTNSKGRVLSKEHKKRIGDSNRGKKLSKEQVEGMRIRMKTLWASFTEEQRNEQVTRILTAQYPFPTSLEQHCINIFKEYNIPLIYTGNGLLNSKKFAIGGCYPDFVNLKNKIVVEVYACFHKRKQYGSVENYQQKRLKRMKGWKVYFFDENQVFSSKFIFCIKNIFKDILKINEVNEKWQEN